MATECIARGIAAWSFRSGQRRRRTAWDEPPVFCAGLSVRGTAKAPRNINHPICSAAPIIYPGDIILGDDDGVVVVPLGEAEGFSSRPTKGRRPRSSQETSFAGESLFDIYGIKRFWTASIA
jgi:4-hydroxy-4-methyl-2-oxoglutarate aldolase